MSKSGFMKDAVILFAITLVSGFLLGGVYQLTKKPIELATIAANNKAYKAVFNEAESFDPDDALTAAVEGCNADLAGMDFGGVKVENVLKAGDGSGNQLGYVITSLSNDSYGGAVKVSVGIKEDGTITGIEFLEINDTPGLGLKAKEPKFKDQFIGKKAESLSVTKMGNADDTQINAISGATITSSATTNAVNAALYYLHNCIK
mgnify:FL=1